MIKVQYTGFRMMFLFKIIVFLFYLYSWQSIYLHKCMLYGYFVYWCIFEAWSSSFINTSLIFLHGLNLVILQFNYRIKVIMYDLIILTLTYLSRIARNRTTALWFVDLPRQLREQVALHDPRYEVKVLWFNSRLL